MKKLTKVGCECLSIVFSNASIHFSFSSESRAEYEKIVKTSFIIVHHCTVGLSWLVWQTIMSSQDPINSGWAGTQLQTVWTWLSQVAMTLELATFQLATECLTPSFTKSRLNMKHIVFWYCFELLATS